MAPFGNLDPFGSFGRTLITLGIALVVLGFLFLVAPKIPFLGRLPGDIHYRGKNFSFHFPLATSNRHQHHPHHPFEPVHPPVRPPL